VYKCSIDKNQLNLLLDIQSRRMSMNVRDVWATDHLNQNVRWGTVQNFCKAGGQKYLTTNLTYMLKFLQPKIDRGGGTCKCVPAYIVSTGSG